MCYCRKAKKSTLTQKEQSVSPVKRRSSNVKFMPAASNKHDVVSDDDMIVDTPKKNTTPAKRARGTPFPKRASVPNITPGKRVKRDSSDGEESGSPEA